MGAVYTEKYRNLFKELGYSDAEIDEKVESAWQKLFYGNDEERIYYPVGEDMAYIYTADTDDVRSEGMSYGMMICVQMDKQEEFNRLWKWAKTYMQHTSGEFKGYFAWQMKTEAKSRVRRHQTARNILQHRYCLHQRAGEMVKEFITITKKRRKS